MDPGTGPAADAGDDATAPDAVELAWRRARGAARARGARPGAGGRSRQRPGWEVSATAPGPDPRDPQLLGDLTGELVADQGWAERLSVAGVMGRWPEVVGADVAARCTPERFEGGVLLVRAETTAWATQLGYLAADLARRLAEVVGDGVVERVEVVGPERPSWRRGRLRTPYARGARDTYG